MQQPKALRCIKIKLLERQNEIISQVLSIWRLAFCGRKILKIYFLYSIQESFLHGRTQYLVNTFLYYCHVTWITCKNRYKFSAENSVQSHCFVSIPIIRGLSHMAECYLWIIISSFLHLLVKKSWYIFIFLTGKTAPGEKHLDC